MDCFQMSRPVRCIFNYGSQTLTQFNANLILMMLKRFQVDKKKKKIRQIQRNLFTNISGNIRHY